MTANGNGDAIDIRDFYSHAQITLNSSAGGGADHTLDVKLQESDDGSTGWADIAGAAFTQVTNAAAAFETLTLDLDKRKRYIRPVDTVAGTSPEFSRGIITGRSQAVQLRRTPWGHLHRPLRITTSRSSMRWATTPHWISMATAINVVAVKGLFQLPVDQTHIGTIRRNVIEAEFKGRTADLSSAIKGTSQLTESGLTYDVVDIPPSVDGITVLVLRPAT
ncbi:hypothetical protein [Thiohalophilus sp.]|uniref:hypothetical protein n=1 Tax=Thiohalophilus sp. TaxID=3028392 RepID=UPI002ACDBBE3|nr:hypothetical protein [Thiohalophilus sp.]MDZ7804331.1 hypothetical protein [Thiohalophilus sp.]